ncbi:MAG: hypothetical protein ACLP1Y_12610 [Candidatus Acidiferrales bacterium]
MKQVLRHAIATARQLLARVAGNAAFTQATTLTANEVVAISLLAAHAMPPKARNKSRA